MVMLSLMMRHRYPLLCLALTVVALDLISQPVSASAGVSASQSVMQEEEGEDGGCPGSGGGLIPISSGYFWMYVGVCCFLVLVGGIVSGLTIGLFSLSNLELEVLQEDVEADAADRRRAKRLEPLLRQERHHLLLVTLLLTNTAAMEALPEMLDKLVPDWAAVVISVSLVLLFSEIIPQSICTRSPLAAGAFFSPLVWLLMLLLFPVSWPIAKALDFLIGKEGGTQFLASRSQVTSLLEIIKRHNVNTAQYSHCTARDMPTPSAALRERLTGLLSCRLSLSLCAALWLQVLTVEEAKIMQTVVQLRNKQIKDVMIPPEEIYMVAPY
jgi:Cyclin M transmembrane N-terminal domain